jgi:glycosyltransferase involved in cell wall biosynthesis
VLKVRPDARLLVVGSGQLEEKLESLAGELLPEGSYRFLGQRSDVENILAGIDVVLVTSFREGMPHVVLEAMAAGRPIVATAVAGIPEMLRDGTDGLLIPAGSHTAAAAAVVRLLAEPALAESLARSATERVESEFSLEAMVDRVERCFEEELALVRGGARL